MSKNLPTFVEAVEKAGFPSRLSVIDNASADKSRRVVESWGGRVGWIPMKENRVLCAYNEVAPTLEEDLLVFMNNDIAVDPGFLDPLIRPFLADKDVFFVTPKCLSHDRITYEGNKTRGGVRYGVYWASCRYPGYREGIDTPSLTLQGGFGAFDKKKFLELGGYDPLYLPGRLEDADICFRAYKRGWKCLYQPESVVFHEGGVSFHRAFGRKGTLVINWRNTFLFMWKNLSDWTILAGFLFWIPARASYSLVSGKPELAIGLFQALPLIPEALRRRAKLKAGGFLRSVPDKTIFGSV
ncbi:MAG: glycosyltransferase [Candidatus Omnitrophica bacterium]|nr:glycosyltransferase [Candidatus Omnitrophota bacterium]